MTDLTTLTEYYFNRNKEFLTKKQKDEYKKIILNALKQQPLLEAELDFIVRNKLKLPIYPTDDIIKELQKENKITIKDKIYLKKKKPTSLEHWF